MLLIQASTSQSSRKSNLGFYAFQNLKDKYWIKSLTWTFGQQPFRLFLRSVLLSLGFQCIHVSRELSFSSKNKLLWEFLVHSVSFSHTTNCLIIVNLLTIQAEYFSPNKENCIISQMLLYKSPNLSLFPIKIQRTKTTWNVFPFNQVSLTQL